MADEYWKDIKGYEGLYQVSNLGNIKSIDRSIKRSTSLMKL
ncbi:NUMOD4 domain-containing protein [Staphylococcus pseudintermedius]